MLQGDSFPITNSPWGTAYIDLFTPNDACSSAAQKLINGNHSEVVNLFYGDCPTRLSNYTTYCSNEIDDDDFNEVNINVMYME